MKKVKIIMLVIVSLLLVGCSSGNNKILGIVELNKTTLEELESLNFESEEYEVWNEEEGIYENNYIWHYANYNIDNIQGIIRIPFQNEVALFVNFSAEATTENMQGMLNYLIDTYGKNYETIEDYTTRWTFDDLIIDYVLTDEGTVEIRWYQE